MSDESMLPPKKDVALALVQTANSVYVHLDPRGEDVLVPPWLKKEPQLVLQIGMNMAVPIVDLDIGEEALSCTLSFSRRPHYCYLPWQAIFGLVGEDGRGMIWPESVPPEVASRAPGRATAPQKDPPQKRRRGNLRLAKDPETERASLDSAEPSARSEQETDGPVGEESAGTRQDEPGEHRAEQGVEATLEKDESADPSEKGGTGHSGGGRRRELPPYLRVVK